MNDSLNKLPSVGNMIKLIVILLLGMMAIGLVMAIVKMLVPLVIVALLVLGGLYLYRQVSDPHRA